MVGERRRQRLLVAASGVLSAGLILSASAVGVSARPLVQQVDPQAGPTALAAPIGAGAGAHPTISGDG